MKSALAIRLPALTSCLVAATLLAACSSGGSSTPSQSQVEAKLKKEPDIAKLYKAGGKEASVAGKLVSCAAGALEKDADPSSLTDYVNGKTDIDDLKPKSGDAKDDARTTVENCTKTALKGSGISG